MQNGDGDGKFMGGFSLSNLQGPTLFAGLIVAGAFVYLGGLYWFFRDVAQF